MPRAGVAWDPTGTRTWAVRGSYGLFYDQFQNGSGTASQIAISATPAAQFVQFSGAGLNFQNPFLGLPYPQSDSFVRLSTQFVMDTEMKPPAVQNCNSGCAAIALQEYPRRGPLRGCFGQAPASQRRVNPGGVRAGAPDRTPTVGASTRTVRPDGGACDYSTIAMLTSIAEIAISRGTVQPVTTLRRCRRDSTSWTGFRRPWTHCPR